MSSYELLAPRKNWSDLVVNSVDANSVNSPAITTDGRVRQDNNRLTPVALWAIFNDQNIGATTPTFAMGTFVGPVHIDSDAVYRPMSTRIVVSGTLNAPVADVLTISIRDLAGTFLHASVSSGSVTGTFSVCVEFNIQVATPGGPGTGFQRSVGTMNISASNGVTQIVSNNTTFDSTGGIDYYLYVNHSAVGCTFTRQLAYANILI